MPLRSGKDHHTSAASSVPFPEKTLEVAQNSGNAVQAAPSESSALTEIDDRANGDKENENTIDSQDTTYLSTGPIENTMTPTENVECTPGRATAAEALK